MEENKFFKFLWRVNAVFLFFAGIGLIGILLTIGGILVSEMSHEDAPPPTVNTPVKKRAVEEVFSISPHRKSGSVDGFTYFELESEAESYGGFSSGSGKVFQTRNIGVFNLLTNEMNWIFPNAQQEIENFVEIEKSIPTDDGKTKNVTKGFLMTVATSLADRSISRDLWIMSPDGKDFRKILPNIAERPNIRTFEGNRKKLLFKTKDGLDVYALDVDALTLGPRTKIPLP